MQAEIDEETSFEGIAGTLRGPHIRNTSASTSSISSRVPTTRATCTPHSIFVPKNILGVQPSLEGIGWNKEVHQQADKACANFWYFNNLPFNVTSSPYWENLVIALTVVGKNYKTPSQKDLSGWLVNKLYADL
jgi:hypothetical protein